MLESFPVATGQQTNTHILASARCTLLHTQLQEGQSKTIFQYVGLGTFGVHPWTYICWSMCFQVTCDAHSKYTYEYLAARAYFELDQYSGSKWRTFTSTEEHRYGEESIRWILKCDAKQHWIALQKIADSRSSEKCCSLRSTAIIFDSCQHDRLP